MDGSDQPTERKQSLTEWYEEFRAKQAARDAQIKAEAMENARAAIAKYQQEIEQQEARDKAAKKAREVETVREQAVLKGCQFTPANSNQSLGQTKRSAREDESLFIDSAVPKKTSNSREMRVGDVPASEKRKSGGLIIGEVIGDPKPVIASRLAPSKRKRMKKDNPSERKPVATNASIEAPLNQITRPREPESTTSEHEIPDWYSTVNATDNRYRSDSLTLRDLCRLSKKVSGDLNQTQLEQANGQLRNFLHQMALFDFAGREKEIIKKSMLLTDNTFDVLIKQPFTQDIRELAVSLRLRWWEGDTDPNLMRGIKRSVSKTKDGNNHTIHILDSQYPFKVSPNYAGHGNLFNGKWWPLQICAVRDGAHGEIEAGIHGLKSQGAFSIVVSGGGYANIDEGDTIQYCGTANVKNTPSQATNLMLLALRKHQSIRVLRSSKARSEYSPSTGIRYDGLYMITSFEVIDVDTALHRFTLQRKSGQSPIYYTGPAARPNKAEVEAMERDKLLRAMVS